MSSALRKEQLASDKNVRNAPALVVATKGSVSSAVARAPFPVSSVSSGVFSINFIRHEFLSPRVRRVLLAAGIGWLGLNALILAGQIAMTGVAYQQTWTLKKNVKAQIASAQTLSGASQEMDTLRERAADNLAQLNTVISQEAQRFPVAGKLAGLTRTLPPRTWLTSLSGDRSAHTMTIQAAYLINPDSPYDLPAKDWLAALRQDPGFREGLTRLEMGQSSRKRVGEAELFVFDLEATWQ